jgi:hypothetical protein
MIGSNVVDQFRYSVTACLNGYEDRGKKLKFLQTFIDTPNPYIPAWQTGIIAELLIEIASS